MLCCVVLCCVVYTFQMNRKSKNQSIAFIPLKYNFSKIPKNWSVIEALLPSTQPLKHYKVIRSHCKWSGFCQTNTQTHQLNSTFGLFFLSNTFLTPFSSAHRMTGNNKREMHTNQYNDHNSANNKKNSLVLRLFCQNFVVIITDIDQFAVRSHLAI